MNLFLKSADGSVVPFDGIKTVTTTDWSHNATDDDFDWYDNGGVMYGFAKTADPYSFTVTVKPSLTRVQRLMMLYQLQSVREARLVIRHEERLRRWMLKTWNRKYRLTGELWAVREVICSRGRYRR